MTNEQIITEAVKRAQAEGHITGFTLGQIVAHPDDSLAGELLFIDAEVARLDHGGYQKEWPANEIFDPTVALKFSLEIQFKGLEVVIR